MSFPAQHYRVRWGGNYAVKFGTRFYQVVADQEASTFNSPEAALAQAVAVGMRAGQFTIEGFEPNTQPRKEKSR